MVIYIGREMVISGNHSHSLPNASKLKLAQSDRPKNAALVGSSHFSSQYPQLLNLFLVLEILAFSTSLVLLLWYYSVVGSEHKFSGIQEMNK